MLDNRCWIAAFRRDRVAEGPQGGKRCDQHRASRHGHGSGSWQRTSRTFSPLIAPAKRNRIQARGFTLNDRSLSIGWADTPACAVATIAPALPVVAGIGGIAVTAIEARRYPGG